MSPISRSPGIVVCLPQVVVYTDGIQRFYRESSAGTLKPLDKVTHGMLVSAATTDPTGDYVVRPQIWSSGRPLSNNMSRSLDAYGTNHHVEEHRSPDDEKPVLRSEHCMSEHGASRAYAGGKVVPALAYVFRRQ